MQGSSGEDRPDVPLLTTKIRVPRRRSGLVERTRLLDPLRTGTAPTVTLVSAPAGFGKTTLLVDWLASGPDDLAVAWVQLDPSDDDPVRFWSYVVAALRSVAPEVGSGSLALLESPDVAMEVGVATLLNELDAVREDLVLVLDDYHVVERREIQDAMQFLVEHLPPQVRLVVASRADPPWPLGALRARGALREVRVADLRFTEDEAASYLNESMGLTLRADDVRTIEGRTEGWIAALQLAALSMQGRDDVAGFIAGFAGDDRHIVDYLVGEVLGRQSDHDRNFLLHTSILGRLSGPLCDAVTARGCAQETLERLDRTNLFLLPLDDRRVWYRYHHLFAEMLRARLRDEHPDDVAALHERASTWFEANGDLPEAIDHALAGGDPERAAVLLERVAPAMQRARRESTLRAWLEALPEQFFADRPVLAMALVGARMATGATDGVDALVESIERWLVPPGEGGARPVVVDDDAYRRLPAQVAIHRAGLALLAGDTDETIACADRALSLLGPDEHLGHGAATTLLGLAHWTTGDLATARARYEAALGDFVAADHVTDLLGVTLGLADIEIAQGALRDATRTLARGLDTAGGTPALRGTADLHVALAEVAIEQGDLGAATRRLETSRALGEQAGLPQHPYRSLATTARLRQAEGDLDGALALLDAAERVVDTDFSPAVRPIPARRARIRLAMGQVDDARSWAREAGVRADDAPSYVREYEHLTLARTMLAAAGSGRPDGSLDDVVTFLGRLLDAAEAGSRTGTVVEVSMLLALAHDARGDAAAAERSLRDALDRAAPDGHVQVFLDAGPAMRRLLRRVEVAGPAADLVDRLTGPEPEPQAVSPAPAAPAGERLVEPLSERELDVLRLLRTDLSGPDIARELYVSLNTLRTHTKAIYTKLAVNSRRAAVRRADELGL